VILAIYVNSVRVEHSDENPGIASLQIENTTGQLDDRYGIYHSFSNVIEHQPPVTKTILPMFFRASI
jgi:hypothetical protein